jgi:hypothetical protein
MASITRRVAQLKRFSHQVFDSRTVHAACDRVNHRWRERLLDPVTTLRLFMLAVLHGNVACRTVRHLADMDCSCTTSCG